MLLDITALTKFAASTLCRSDCVPKSLIVALALMAPPALAQTQASLATIRDITVDTAGNASYSLVIDSILIEAIKQGAPCNGFSPDDEVIVSYGETTLTLTKDSRVCRLVIHRPP